VSYSRIFDIVNTSYELNIDDQSLINLMKSQTEFVLKPFSLPTVNHGNVSMDMTQISRIAFRMDGTATNIPSNTFQYCSNLIGAMIFPDGINTIGDNVMTLGFMYNESIHFPKNLFQIGNSFFALTTQNIPVTRSLSPIDTPTLRDSASGSYNKPIYLPDGLAAIGNNFFYDSLSYNSSLRLPSTLNIIGDNFLHAPVKSGTFNQPFEIPQSVTVIGSGFLTEQVQMRSRIYVPGRTSKPIA
jgi:hypothetical protein